LIVFLGAVLVVETRLIASVLLFANFDKLVIFLINMLIIHTNTINHPKTLVANMFIIQKLVVSVGMLSILL
jgi:hypothetical protein